MDQQPEDRLPQLPEAHQSGKPLTLFFFLSLPAWSQRSGDQEGAFTSGIVPLLTGGRLPGCVTSHKSLHLPEPQFPHL